MIMNPLQESAQLLASLCLPKEKRESSTRGIPRWIRLKKCGARVKREENENYKLKRRNGLRHYSKLKEKIAKQSRIRDQIALTISVPAFTPEEEALINSSKGKITKELMIDSFSAERIREEVTWVFVRKDWETIFERYYILFSQCDDGGIHLITQENLTSPDNHFLKEIPVRDNIRWDNETSSIMHVAIHHFFHYNREMWAQSRKKPDYKVLAFTHLMAITMVIYQIDYWHNHTTDVEDLVDIAKMISLRWRGVLRRSSSTIGQDENGRRGIEMFMRQLENNWKESRSNQLLGNKFKLVWR